MPPAQRNALDISTFLVQGFSSMPFASFNQDPLARFRNTRQKRSSWQDNSTVPGEPTVILFDCWQIAGELDFGQVVEEGPDKRPGRGKTAADASSLSPGWVGAPRHAPVRGIIQDEVPVAMPR